VKPPLQVRSRVGNFAQVQFKNSKTLRKSVSVCIIVFAACWHKSSAQLSKESTKSPIGIYSVKGDYYFHHNVVSTAIAHYNNAVIQNPKDCHAMLRIAEIYDRLGNTDLAGQWYNKALHANPNVSEKYILNYISILIKDEKPDEARYWVSVYNERMNMMKSFNDTLARSTDSTLMIVKNLKPLNSNKADVGATMNIDQLIFCSARSGSADGNFDLYRSVLQSDGQYQEPLPLPGAINTGANEGPVAIAQQAGKIFFGRSGQSQDAKKAIAEIFLADLAGAGETKIDKVAIKKFRQGMAHPAVSSDGTHLYFTSSNQKNKQGFDLYRTDHEKGKWSTPEPLGTTINTNGDEVYPSLHNDTTLYFASNGHGGLGGFDIYKVNVFDPVAKVEHLEAPLNSSSNDFGLTLDKDGSEGYLTSNRPGGLGNDDVYKLYILRLKTMKPDRTIIDHLDRPGELSIYTSTGDVIKLSEKQNKKLGFDFIPGISYKLTMEFDNYKEQTVRPEKMNMNIMKSDIYTFHIQNLIETAYKQASGSTRVKDIHINPGDLVTFHLLPNLKGLAESSNSKVQFNKQEAVISSRDTIVFSYVAEGVPVSPAPSDTISLVDTAALVSNAPRPNSAAALRRNADPNNVVPTANAAQQNKPEEINKLTNSLTAIAQVTDSVSSADARLAKQNSIQRRLEDESLAVARQPKASTTLMGSNLEVALNIQLPVVDSSKSQSTNIAGSQRIESAQEIQSGNERQIVDSLAQNSTAVEVARQDKREEIGLTTETIKADGSKNSDRLVAKVSSPTSNNIDAQKNNIPNNNSIKSDSLSPSPRADVAVSSMEDNQTIAAKPNVNDSPESVASSDFQYRVQIAAAGAEISDEQLRKIYNGPDEIHAFKEDGYYKYYIGGSPTYPEAMKILKESKVENAFIAVYNGGKKWKLYEAIAFQRKNPEKIQSVSANQNVNPGPGIDPAMENPTSIEQVVNNNAKLDSSADSNEIKSTDGPITTDSLLNSNGVAAQKKDTALENSGKGSGSIGYQMETTTPMDNAIDVTKKSQSIDSALSPTPVDYSAGNAEKGDDFRYRVQIAASTSEISNAQLKSIYSGPSEIKGLKEGEYYKYYIKETSSYYVARQALKESNVGNAFIAAYKGDTKWALPEAVASQNKVPKERSVLAQSDSIVTIIIVNFGYDEFTLPPMERQKLLDNVIDKLKTNQGYYTKVSGYTDIRGSEEYNFGLSQERALFVKQLIIDEGIRPERVTTQYFGESQVLKYCQGNCDESVHQANRRVEVLLLVKK
jgi:outer membrane protein OmpA-like peptidoglycan-associated protein